MKRTLVATFLCFVLMGSQTVWAQVNYWVGVSGGLQVSHHDAHIQDNTTDAHDPGLNKLSGVVGVTIGARYLSEKSWFVAGEVEGFLGQNKANMQQDTLGGSSRPVQLSVNRSGMSAFSVKAGHKVGEIAYPYVRFGIEISQFQTQFQGGVPTPVNRLEGSHNATRVGVAPGLGVDVDLGQGWSLTLDSRVSWYRSFERYFVSTAGDRGGFSVKPRFILITAGLKRFF